MSTTTNSLEHVAEKITEVTAKVDHASDCIDNIKAAIVEKGVEVPTGTTLTELPEKIKAITTEEQPLTDPELEDFLADIFAEGTEGGTGENIESEG